MVAIAAGIVGIAAAGYGAYQSSQNRGNTGLSGTTSGQSTEQDAVTQALNQYRLQQLQNIPGSEYFLDQTNRYAQTSDFTDQLTSQGGQFSEQYGLDPTNWYQQALSNLNPSGAQQSLNSWLENSGQTLGNLTGQNAGQLDRLNDRNINYINNNLAPRLLGSGQDYFRQILSPGITNDMSLMGLARSGGNQEAQAKGAASISLPISQLIAQLTSNAQQGNYQGQLANMQQGFSGQQQLQNFGVESNFNLQRQYLQNLFGLNQSQPNVDTTLRAGQLSRLGQGIQFSDYSRQVGAQQQNKALEQFLSMFTNTPYNPQPDITRTENSGLLSGLGGSGALSTVAGALSTAKSSGLFGSSNSNPTISATPYAGITATPTTSAPTGSFIIS